MKGLMRLYPESPIVVCEYDYISRIIKPFGFMLMRPFTPEERRDATWDLALATCAAKMRDESSVVFATCYHAITNLYVRASGFVEAVPSCLTEDTEIIRYVNVFNDAPYFPFEPRITISYLRTQQPFDFMPTRPAKLLYFPNQNLLFDGYKHYPRTTESIQPLKIYDERLEYQQFLNGE